MSKALKCKPVSMKEVYKSLRLKSILADQKVCVAIAERKHPRWNSNPSRGLTIIAEEVGELAEAINKYEDEGGNPNEIEKEAFHILATTTRFLLSFRKRDWKKK